jgi:hypothetical protein
MLGGCVMKTLPVSQDAGLNFRVRSPLSVVRDLLIIALCAALIGGFLAQIWDRPPESPARAAVPPAACPTPG